MITARIDDATRTGQIVLRPNASWSWRYNVYLVATLAGVSLVIGLGFLAAGAWLVLPFSFVEIAVLMSCVYYVLRQCMRQEVITVSESEVTVEKGRLVPVETLHFDRFWSRFLVQPARRYSDPAIVSIRFRDEQTELGSFLNRDDKQELIALLKRVVPD